MDPLSLTASLIAVLGASSTIVKGLRKLLAASKAPQELQSLLNDVTSLRMVLKLVQTTLRHVKDTRGEDLINEVQQDVEALVRPVEDCVQELDNFVASRLKWRQEFDRRGLPRASRVAWLTFAKEVEKLRQHIRDVRGNLDTALSSFHILLGSTAHRTVVQVQNIAIETFEEVKSAQHEARTNIQDMTRHIEAQLSTLTASGQNPVTDRDGEQNVAKVFNTSPQDQIHQGIPSVSPKKICITTSINGASCPRFCRCQCHRQNIVATPRWLKGLFGYLLFSYTGSSLIHTTPCDYPRCQNTSRQSTFMYYFPTWAAARALMLCADSKDLSGVGAKWSLRVPVVLRDADPIWQAAQNGSIDFIRQQFSHRKATAYVVDSNGWTLLHWAASWDQSTCYKYLKSCGADETQEDKTKSNPLDLALTFGSLSRLSRFMDNTDDMMDVLSFSPLHLAAMSLEGSLSELIDPYFKDINAQDRCGMTPLHWACSRDNKEAVTILLEWQARVDVQDHQGALPLHHACRTGNVDIITAILNAGSDACKVDNHGETGIFYVRAPIVLATLVRYGMDLNHHSLSGQTALHYAAGDTNRKELTASLVEHGADINVENEQGCTPLMTAVIKDCADTLEVLLQKGARMDGLTSTGQNILHLAALYAGPRVHDMLRENFPSNNIDPEALDLHANTPSNCFSNHRDTDNTNSRAAPDDEGRSWSALLNVAHQQNANSSMASSTGTPQAGASIMKLLDRSPNTPIPSRMPGSFT